MFLRTRGPSIGPIEGEAGTVLGPFVCGYVPAVFPGNTSLDIFGGSESYNNITYNPASPVYPSTALLISGVDYAGNPLTLYGTPNSGSNFGINNSVCSGVQVVEVRWSWDTLNLGSPRICEIGLMLNQGTDVQGSDDGVNWTTVIASGIAGFTSISPTSYRYWALHWKATVGVPGLYFFSGPSFLALMLWSGNY